MSKFDTAPSIDRAEIDHHALFNWTDGNYPAMGVGSSLSTAGFPLHSGTPLDGG